MLGMAPGCGSDASVGWELVDELKRVYRKSVFWLRSDWIISCGGAPLSILKQ